MNNYTILFNKVVNTFINSIVKPFFKKLKFKGKGYYLYKNYRNTITPQFGYSHRLYLYSFFCKVKFLSKTSLICFGLSVTSVKNTSTNLVNWRRINIFTGRGVRFSKQIIYKKVGKVSSYR
jgi:ribosomal protein L6P/L9E